MWTSKNRARYDRSKLRYPSDLGPHQGVEIPLQRLLQGANPISARLCTAGAPFFVLGRPITAR
jgi:hypothetical protein